jgi:hypothetical protein
VIQNRARAEVTNPYCVGVCAKAAVQGSFTGIVDSKHNVAGIVAGIMCNFIFGE